MNHLNTLVAGLGAALLTSAAFTVQAAGNPFAAQELSSGYSLAAGEKSAEGSCGEGKCGGEMKTESEGKCGEGKCGEGKCGGAAKPDAKPDAKAEAEGKCGEGKCGEGKCGAEKQDV